MYLVHPPHDILSISIFFEFSRQKFLQECKYRLDCLPVWHTFIYATPDLGTSDLSVSLSIGSQKSEELLKYPKVNQRHARPKQILHLQLFFLHPLLGCAPSFQGLFPSATALQLMLA